jgi:hypothetical protein
METRAKSWHFATILNLPPEVEHSIACNSHISEDVVKRVLKSQILNGLRPDPIFSVQVRYKLSDLRNPSSELPLNGYVQFSLNKSWLDTCCSDGSEHNGAQWGAIVVARRSTSNSVNTIPIMSVSHCWKNLLEIREEGHRRKKRYNSCSFIHAKSCRRKPLKFSNMCSASAA